MSFFSVGFRTVEVILCCFCKWGCQLRKQQAIFLSVLWIIQYGNAYWNSAKVYASTQCPKKGMDFKLTLLRSNHRYIRYSAQDSTWVNWFGNIIRSYPHLPPPNTPHHPPPQKKKIILCFCTLWTIPWHLHRRNYTISCRNKRITVRSVVYTNEWLFFDRSHGPLAMMILSQQSQHNLRL